MSDIFTKDEIEFIEWRSISDSACSSEDLAKLIELLARAHKAYKKAQADIDKVAKQSYNDGYLVGRKIYDGRGPW